MKTRLLNFAAKFKLRFYAWMIALNGYRCCAVIMFILYLGARAQPNSNSFVSIAMHFPVLSEFFWETYFLIGAGMMWMVRDGKYDMLISFLGFVLPAGSFYLLRVVFALQEPGLGRTDPQYFSAALLVSALLLMVVFVIRTKAVNYYRILTLSQAQEIVNLRGQIIKQGGSSA